VERAFRCIKTVDLQVRPVHHWLADRVASMLFDETERQATRCARA
jgi:hypothetical protein